MVGALPCITRPGLHTLQKVKTGLSLWPQGVAQSYFNPNFLPSEVILTLGFHLVPEDSHSEALGHESGGLRTAPGDQEVAGAG